ncbi:MAG: hypothetical protein OXT49_03650 [Gammaproteobacteria bacterium]|nr:hypothetical protein [Gammaproteobacteria bacterium]
MNNSLTKTLLMAVSLASLFLSAPAAAEMCLAANPKASAIEVRNGPDGKLLGKLPNGTKVYKRALDWGMSGPAALIAGEYQGQWRDFGFVAEGHINCSNSDDSTVFPLVFSSAKDLRELGIALSGFGAEQPKPFPNQCFYYGDGGYSMSLSQEMVDRYKALGVNQETLCFVFRVGGLRFDPESGERLPTYMLADTQTLERYGPEMIEPSTLSGELPLHVPPCFRKGQVKEIMFGREMQHSCEFKYDPWTGVPLSPVEMAYYKENVRLEISGEAGPSAAPADAKLALDEKKRATKASVKSVLEFWE